MLAAATFNPADLGRADDRLARAETAAVRRGADQRPGALGRQAPEPVTIEVRPPFFLQVGWLCPAASLPCTQSGSFPVVWSPP
jgi:hypothetical protein